VFLHVLSDWMRRSFSVLHKLRTTPITLQYSDLVNGVDVTADIAAGFGRGGLGAIAVAGVPGFGPMRRNLLPLSHRLAHLSQSELAKLEHPESLWNAGWSCGREKIGDLPDYNKGVNGKCL
jgi:hypothetical protein